MPPPRAERLVVIGERADGLDKAINLARDRVLKQLKRERGRLSWPRRTRQLAPQAQAGTARANFGAPSKLGAQALRQYERSTARP